MKNHKKIVGILFSTIIALMFVGCEEEAPFIQYKISKTLKDSTFITTDIVTPQKKSVLLFDVTGVRCNNCPKAAAEAKRLLDIHKEKLVVVALYPTSGGILTLPWNGYENLRTDFAEQLVQYIEPFPSLPVGYVDQSKSDNKLLISYPSWGTAINKRLAESSPANIELKVIKYDTLADSDSSITVNIKITYLKNISAAEKHKFTIGLMQSHISSKQTTPTGKDEHYIHNHVLRTMLTNATGDLLNSTLEKNRVFEKEYKIKMKKNWKPYECTIFAYIHNAKTKEVYQAKEKHL